MCCSDNAKRLQLDNLLSFMLHKLVILGYQSHFASYPYSFASCSYSCKILQPYVAPTVWMHYDEDYPPSGAPLLKTVIKNHRH